MKPYTPLFETCPEGAKPRNGKCAKKDNSGYLKGVCDKGHIWDDDHEKCVSAAKESIRHYWKSIFTEENALGLLKNVNLIDDLFEFFKSNPYPKDHEQLHAFAEQKGVESEELEQYVYAIVSAVVCGGKSAGMDQSIFPADQITKGMKVEQEHLDMSNYGNPVVKRIIDLLSTKIACDHQAEFVGQDTPAKYYDALDEMEKKLK